MKEFLRGFRHIGLNARLLIIVSFFAYAGIGVYAVIFNLYLVRLGFREDFIGAFQALSVLGTGLLAIPIGMLSNRIGHKRTLVVGVVLLVASATGQALIVHVAALLFAGFLNGVSLACLVVPLTPLLAEVSGERERSHVYSANYANISLATTIGSLVGGQLPGIAHLLWMGLVPGGVGTYRFTLLVGAALAGLAIAPLILVHTAERHGSGSRAAPGDGSEEVTESQAWRNIWVFASSVGLVGLGAALVIPFFNVYFSEVLRTPTEAVGYIFALANVVAAVASLATPVLQKRFGLVRSITWVRVCTIPLFVALAFSPSLGLGVAAYVARMTFMSMSWPLDSTLIMQSVTTRLRATAISLRSATWNISWAGASFAAGYLIVQFGYSSMFLATGCLTLAGVLLQHFYFAGVPRFSFAFRLKPAAARAPVLAGNLEPEDLDAASPAAEVGSEPGAGSNPEGPGGENSD